MTCATCKDRDTCKTLCKEIKKQLSDEGIKRINWMKPRMTGGGSYREVNSLDIDKLATLRAFELKYGRRKKKHTIDNQD